jgi:hypothetical protein
MNHSVRGAAVAVVVLSAVLVVSGCKGGGGGGGDGAAGAPSSAAVVASATPASPAPSAAGTSTGAGPSAGPSPISSPSPSPSVHAPVKPSPTVPAGCRNLGATAAAKAVVIAAYQTRFPYLTHIETAPGSFYYGVCDGTEYALTQFRSTPGATEQQLVAMQDEGSARKLFERTGGTGWRYVSSDTFPATPGCAPPVPARLAKAWVNCP